MDIKYFKQRLTERSLALNEIVDVGNEAAKPVELDQTKVGRLSRMDAMQAQAMSMEARRRRELELLRIKSALGRIEDNHYGDCLECLEPISQARLELDPSITLCITCAENKDGRFGLPVL